MEKNVDSKGRWRNRNVGFRVSEEEAKLLDDLVELSGLAKQDYIVRRHIVGGTYRTLISVKSSLRLCRTGICRRFSAG